MYLTRAVLVLSGVWWCLTVRVFSDVWWFTGGGFSEGMEMLEMSQSVSVGESTAPLLQKQKEARPPCFLLSEEPLEEEW